SPRGAGRLPAARLRLQRRRAPGERRGLLQGQGRELLRRPAPPCAIARADPAQSGAPSGPAGEREQLPEDLSGEAHDRRTAAGGDVGGHTAVTVVCGMETDATAPTRTFG